ncbi:MAG: YfcE family phosphodiesterase [Pseudomonadales bacterium]|nr:YfcE family phosphodiesterase [Pseudomonadales bacterium]
MRLGLIADTHMPGSLQDLWPEAIDAFDGVDSILHAGDLHTLDIVDELGQIAPTYVARGNGDVGIIDDRLQDTWCFEFDGIKVGLIHRLPSPERKSPASINKYIERHFDCKLDVVVFGHTHFEGLYQLDDILCINPGSPTLPRNQALKRGTLGFLDIDDGQISATILQITETGLSSHESIVPIQTSWV